MPPTLPAVTKKCKAESQRSERGDLLGFIRYEIPIK